MAIYLTADEIASVPEMSREDILYFLANSTDYLNLSTASYAAAFRICSALVDSGDLILRDAARTMYAGATRDHEETEASHAALWRAIAQRTDGAVGEYRDIRLLAREWDLPIEQDEPLSEATLNQAVRALRSAVVPAQAATL